VRSLVAHTGTYKQWIDYWRHLITQEGDTDRKLDQILASSRGNYLACEGETVYLPSDVANDSHKALNHLFYLLVSEFPQQQEEEAGLGLTARCDEIIRKYQLNRNPHFKESPIIELPLATDVKQHIIPSFAWVNGAEVYFQKVSIVPVRPESSQKNVNNAAWIFEKLKQGNPLRVTKALVKVMEQSAPEEMTNSTIRPAEYLAVLRELSDHVIDVDNEETVEKTFAPLAAVN
jgi:hypothetical protein